MKQIILALALLSFGGCMAHGYKDLSVWNETPEQSLQLQLRSIKTKRTKSDLVVAVKNMYKFPIVISEGAIHYSVNGDDGIASNPSVRRILNPGDTAAFALKFRFAIPEAGTGVLKVENVYSGKAIEVQGTSGKTNIGVGLIGGAGPGKANVDTSSESFQKRGAIEDQPLPSATLQVPN